jgi:hypothetical protein
MSNDLKSILEMLIGLKGDIQDINRGQAALAERVSRIEQASVAPIPEIKLQGPLYSKSVGPEGDAILCLDFGTARSKAYATQGEDSEPIDIAVGQRAGSQRFTHSVASVLYIDGEGKIHFGDKALEESESAVQAGSRERLDDLKVHYIHGPDSELNDVILNAKQNPITGIPLSAAGILSLFLAYLTDLAGSELKAKGISRYVKRRFTIPAFTGPKQEQVSARLVNHFA